MRINNELFAYKSNVLIQNYAWHLKKNQLKIFEFLCACYDTEYYDKSENTLKITISDFAKEVGIKKEEFGGNEYRYFFSTLKQIRDTSIELQVNNHNVRYRKTLSFIYDVKIDEIHNTIECKMSDDYREHMEKHPLGNAFTEVKIIRKMSSKYSIYLYNLIRSWDGTDKVELKVDYIRSMLEVPQSYYSHMGKFNQIIKEAVDEINRLTVFNVTYDSKKTGKKISSIVFYINNIDDKGYIINQVNEQIEYEQLKQDWLDNPYLEIIRNIIVEIFGTKTKKITISQMNYDSDEVIKVFKNVNYNIISSILNKINENECYNNGNYIKYLKEYLKSSLYYETLQYCELQAYKNIFNF